MKIEQRQSVRTRKKFQVVFASEHEFVTAFTIDLGVGGLFLKTDQILDVGEKVYLEFNLPETQDLVEAEAEVRWIRMKGGKDDGMGVKFTALSQDDFSKIATYLDALGMLPGKSQ